MNERQPSNHPKLPEDMKGKLAAVGAGVVLGLIYYIWHAFQADVPGNDRMNKYNSIAIKDRVLTPKISPQSSEK